ncbi:MAG: hypothetical protein IT370_11915 [Deltaproteobacteria bacterium]|nr:hypothetical protein [Deltaproteobacteria bacterium]
MTSRPALLLALVAVAGAGAAGCKKVTRHGDPAAAEATGKAARGERDLKSTELARYLPPDTDRVFALDLAALRGAPLLDVLAIPFMNGPPQPIAHTWDEACKFSPWRDVETMMLGAGPRGPFTWVARGPALNEHPLMDCIIRELAAAGPKHLNPSVTPEGTIYLLNDHAYGFAFVAPHVVVGGPPDRVLHAMSMSRLIGSAKDAPNPALAPLLAKIDAGSSVWLAMTTVQGDLAALGGTGLWGGGRANGAQLELRLSTGLGSAQRARDAATSLASGLVGVAELRASSLADDLVLDLTLTQAQTPGVMKDLGLSP